jgi:hypothetical protein
LFREFNHLLFLTLQKNFSCKFLGKNPEYKKL